MKIAYFGQCSYYINIDENIYPETELDTNPSLTLAQSLTLTTGKRIFAIWFPVFVMTPQFLVLRTRIHHTICGRIQILDHKSISYAKPQ